jgi:hypothetical protein
LIEENIDELGVDINNIELLTNMDESLEKAI